MRSVITESAKNKSIVPRRRYRSGGGDDFSRTTGDHEGMILVHLEEVAATQALAVASLDRKEEGRRM